MKNKIELELEKIGKWYCSKDSKGKPRSKLHQVGWEKFLVQVLDERAVSSIEFGSAAFYLGKYYRKKHIPLFQAALKRAADKAVKNACENSAENAYQLLIALENAGEDPFGPAGVGSLGILDHELNVMVALDYLARDKKK